MKRVLVCLFFVLTASPISAEEKLRRFLYMSTPDGAQKEGASGAGVLVFDIDNGHKFVKRIDIENFKEGLRGFTGCTATGKLYYSTTSRRMGCFDPATDKVVWDKQYVGGCDRSCITIDGKTIYAPTGWWWKGQDDGFLVINAEDGEFIRRIPVNKTAHNSIASLDGKYLYLGTQTTLTQFNASDASVVQTISPVGEKGVFPYTVDSRNKYVYVCLGGHVGFDIVDLETGKVTGRVFAGKEKIPHRTHGAGMTPDEKELWISDQVGKKLFIFDITSHPPKPKGHVNLSIGGHGWVTFSLDGKYAYCHTPDIFDARTKKKIGEFKDQDGKPFATSKFIEVHFRGDKVVEIGSEFGLGRVHSL